MYVVHASEKDVPESALKRTLAPSGDNFCGCSRNDWANSCQSCAVFGHGCELA